MSILNVLRSIPLIFFATCSVTMAQENDPEVTIYPARTVITMNPDMPAVQAVAIAGDKIVGVGSVDELKLTLKDKKNHVDTRFMDKVIVPGFINQHEHPWLAALTLSTHVIAIEDWQLPEKNFPRARTQEEYRQLLAAAVGAHTRLQANPDEVFYSWGYHELWHGSLSRSDLDAISNKVPIVIWQRSAHELIFNTRAMEVFQLDQALVEQFPTSAREQLDLSEGHFWEQGAMMLVPRLFKAIATPERYIPALKMVRQYWHSAGSTGSVEPGGLVNKALLDMQHQVFASADNPFHMDYIPDGKTMAYQHMDNLIPATEELLGWGAGMSRFLPKQVKLFTDGAIFSQLMQMKDGYLDGHEGEWIINPDLFQQAFQKYWDAGYQIHVHQNGDAGLELLLDTVAANMKRNPRPDHRTVVVHFGFSTQEQVQRIKELGLIVSANPYYPVALANEYSRKGIGPERAKEMVRLGDVQRAGIPFSLHSDMPMAPGQTLFLMWSAVNRVTLDGNAVGPGQRITPSQALYGVTLGAAYSLQKEKQLGSIEAGKIANLTVLEENPLTVEPRTIKDIKIWGTVHEGRLLPLAFTP